MLSLSFFRQASQPSPNLTVLQTSGLLFVRAKTATSIPQRRTFSACCAHRNRQSGGHLSQQPQSQSQSQPSSSSSSLSSPSIVDKSEEGTASSSSQSRDLSLPLPADGRTIELDVSGGGTTVKLAELGPLVINVDGSAARITNWAEMTRVERETTIRIVGRRNKARLAALKAKSGGA